MFVLENGIILVMNKLHIKLKKIKLKIATIYLKTKKNLVVKIVFAELEILSETLFRTINNNIKTT